MSSTGLLHAHKVYWETSYIRGVLGFAHILVCCFSRLPESGPMCLAGLGACLQPPSLFVVLCCYGLHQHMSVLGLYTVYVAVHVDGGEGVMCSQHTSLSVWTCIVVWERRTCLGSRLCRSISLVGQGVLAPASSAQTLCGVSKGLAGLACS
jgi:hypothetical protein